MAKPIKSLELHYPMLQFLINTNIPQEEEVTTVFSQKKPPIPTNYIKEMLSLILEENYFQFNGKKQCQT